jgi:hypothetical protein
MEGVTAAALFLSEKARVQLHVVEVADGLDMLANSELR